LEKVTYIHHNESYETDDGMLLYFAYGSNMLRGRLERRLQGLERVCTAYLPGYRLRSDKMSDDGSNKANIESFKDGEVWGVLWAVPIKERRGLDRAEGCFPERRKSHYQPHDVTVFDENGRSRRAMTYIACEGRRSEKDLPMYTWYHRFLALGAKENGLPGEYLEVIERLPRIRDLDEERHDRNMAISDDR